MDEDYVPDPDLLDKYSDEDLLSSFLKYGLLAGAIFQLICIISAILLPALKNDLDDYDEDHKFSNDPLANIRRLQRLRKQEKKKRR